MLLLESGSNELLNVLDFRQEPDQIVICHFCWPFLRLWVRVLGDVFRWNRDH